MWYQICQALRSIYMVGQECKHIITSKFCFLHDDCIKNIKTMQKTHWAVVQAL